MTLAEVADRLEAEAWDRVFATGGQAYVSVGGEAVLDVAFGVDAIDAPVRPDSLFAVYCAGKPVFAVVVASLVAEGELSLDDAVGDVLDRPVGDHLAGLPVGDLLDHTAGLHRLSSTMYVASPPATREGLALAVRPPETWEPGHVGYSEMAAWHILGLMATALTGRSPADLVRERVTAPLGLTRDVYVGGMSDEEYTGERDRIRVNAQITGLRTDPLLAERTRRLRCLPTPAIGNTASARGLGRFYEGLLATLDNTSGDHAPGGGAVPGVAGVLPELVAPHSHGFDHAMGRTCGYGYGFMVGLPDHQFGRRVSDRAFGHSGFGGMTGAFADPAHDLVVAFHLNGRVDTESALDLRRPALVDGIYRAVAGSA